MITLIKGNVKRDFSERAAKIAMEHLGWSEFHTPDKPSEIGKRTSPPVISKPIKLIDPDLTIPKLEEITGNTIKNIVVNDDLGTAYPSQEIVKDPVNDDLGNVQGVNAEVPEGSMPMKEDKPKQKRTRRKK